MVPALGMKLTLWNPVLIVDGIGFREYGNGRTMMVDRLRQMNLMIW